ncbi:unnamed protein product [Rhodiola kirilowii]
MMTTVAFSRSAHSLAAVYSGSKIRAPISRRARFESHRSLNPPLSLRPMSHSAAPESNDTVIEAENNNDVLVQYVVLRRDLIDSWPLGSVVTQGCHASVCAIWTNKDDPLTAEYCSPSNIDSMHKVTLELWIEQPENIPTCLATKPYLKSLVSLYFKKLKLCK